MDQLRACVKTMKDDLSSIHFNFLNQLEKEHRTLSRENKAIPLCEVTRLYRLQTIANTFTDTIEGLENFVDDKQVVDKAPERIIKSMVQDMEIVTIQMHNYCVNEITPMFLTATLPGHKGQVIEKKISSLHMALEKILNVLKEAAHQLHETGLVPECDLHNNSSEIDYGRISRPREPRRRISSDSKVTQSSTAPVKQAFRRSRAMSFMGSDVIKTQDDKGQMSVHNTVLADVLLKQLPLKYENISH